MSATTDRLVDAHLSRLTLAGYRPTSLRARRRVVRAFAEAVAPREVTAATRLDVEAFLGRGLGPASRRNYQDHVKGFFAWALDEGYVEVSPVAKIPPVRVPSAVPRPISEADLLVALAAADVRMRAWLVLMALGGLRCIEVAHLRPQDVIRSGERTLLYLRECKGGGDAYQPAHPLILRVLEEVPIRDDLWWTVTPGTLSKDAGRFLRSVGVDATAHQLRHFAGTSWYRASGHDLLATAALLRHKNVKTTQVYAQLDPTRTADVACAVGLTGLEDKPTPPSPVEGTRPALRLVREEAG